jgi:hypothetical protein
MQNSVTPDLLTAFQTRHACCRALLELSRQQATLIAAEDYAELIEILNSKQALIDHLGRLAGDQQALQLAWRRERDALPADDRARCDAILEETETLLAALLSEDETSSRQLVSRRDVTQRELQSLAVGVQAQEAYDPRSLPVLFRFDVNL